MLPLLAALAVAAPPGFTETKSTAGCTLYKGPVDDQGDVPVRAECHWTDVSVARFHAVFASWENHDEMFSGVVTSTLQRDGSPQLVYQLQRSKGIADREGLLWCGWEAAGDGYRYTWRPASDEPLTPKSGNVRLVRDEGFWEVQPHPDGGVRVTHELRYDPGGRVPGFLVKWFQTSGFAEVVTEVHDHLAN